MIADAPVGIDGEQANSGHLHELIRGLDSDQKRAVTSNAPLLAVIAGAGSGKTAVLTRRVARRCLDGSADALHTVVITFTRQAAAELRRRLRSLGLQDSVMAGTFHAVSLSLLQQHWERTGRRPPTIVQDRKRLIGEVIGPRRTSLIDDLAAEIDWARARNVSPRAYAAAAAVAGRAPRASPDEVERVMGDLESLKRKRGVADLDDLLSLLVEAARGDAEFASILHWRLRHLYVDEAQDMNPLQRAVLDVWRADRDDLTLVGDPSQSIYGFNGTDPTVLTELEGHFPGIEVVRLDTNYRCTPQIVRAGLTTLSHLSTAPATLRSARPDGASVKIYGFANEEDEARSVASLLADSYGPQDSWRRFAVLARTNAQLSLIRTALEEASIPVRPNSNRLDDSLQRFIREVGDLPSRTRLAAWSRDAYAVQLDPAILLDAADDPNERLRDREFLVRVARAVDEYLADGGTDGRAFLAWVRTHRPFDDTSAIHGVDLLTFHAAKGREWDTVVLVGCEEGFMPHASATSSSALEEEIRLAYVAQTRAADRLLLTYAQTRKGRKRRRSPLIDGIDAPTEFSAPTPDFLRDLEERRARRHASDPVLDELVRWRLRMARVSGVDPHLICPEDVLQEIARVRPTSMKALADVPGLGAPLVARAGTSILAAIDVAVSARNADDRDSSTRTYPV